MKNVVTGAQRRRYEVRTRTRDPLKATIDAIERALVESGARSMNILWEGRDVVLVTARTPQGGLVGGRAAVPDHDHASIAIMYAGAVCIRAIIEDRA